MIIIQYINILNITALFQLPTSNKNVTELRSLVDNTSAPFSSLSSLSSDKDTSNALLIHIVMEKVDVESRNRWKTSLDFTKLQTWADCSALLERHCQFLQSIDEAHFFGSKTPCSKTCQNKKASTFTMSKYSC